MTYRVSNISRRVHVSYMLNFFVIVDSFSKCRGQSCFLFHASHLPIINKHVIMDRFTCITKRWKMATDYYANYMPWAMKLYKHQLLTLALYTAQTNIFRRLSHWDRLTHIYASVNNAILGIVDGLSHFRCQTITWTNSGSKLYESVSTTFSEISNVISSVKFCPFFSANICIYNVNSRMKWHVAGQ